VAADIASQELPSFKIIPVQEVDYEDVEAFAKEHIELGHEGAVFKRSNGIWIAGKKDVNMMKIKSEESWDLEVIGQEEGKGKYKGTLGKLHCHWRKHGRPDGAVCVVKVSGMSDDQRHEWWGCGGDFPTICGRVVKVDAMCITPDGMLREPRFKELRDDKLSADVQ
jgi:DNA ligase-1